jgi:hypothetical protein
MVKGGGGDHARVSAVPHSRHFREIHLPFPAPSTMILSPRTPVMRRH